MNDIRPRAMRRHLRVETLEKRELLAATFSPAPTVLPSFSEQTASLLTSPVLQESEVESDFPEFDGGVNQSDVPSAALTAADTLKLHSRPGAEHTIYLDFDGGITEGTSWNNRTGKSTLVDIAYNRSGSSATFSNSELSQIRGIWQVVAEDFAPFDVNVTTEDPGVEALRRSGGSDTEYGIRSLHTSNTNGVCGGCGGVAYIGSFRSSTDLPAYSFNKGVSAGGNTQSHEEGHTLRLSHDGLTSGTTYYAGHGSGNTSWGPIMGGPGSRKLKTWSNGDYHNANQQQDDLERISTLSGFSYRADDHGNTFAVATPLEVSSATDLSGFGVIEQSNDVDLFSFETADGNVSFQVEPFLAHPNLDVWAGIYDDGGTLIAESNRSNNVTASFTDLPLTAGRYFLKVDGVGTHGAYHSSLDRVFDPGEPDYSGPETVVPWAVSGPTGYSDYASVGQYWITGTRAADPTNLVSIVPLDSVKSEGRPGVTAFTFEVTRTGNVTSQLDLNFAVVAATPAAGGEAYDFTVDHDDFDRGVIPSGTFAIPAGDSAATLTIWVAGDDEFERDESFSVVISDPSAGWTIGDSTATATILSDETSVGVASLNTAVAVQTEGDSADGGPTYSYTLIRRGDLSGETNVSWRVEYDGFAHPASDDDFLGGTRPQGQVVFGVGVAELTVSFDGAGDGDIEFDESFRVAITGVDGPNLSRIDPAIASGRGILLNDEEVSVVEVVVDDDSAQRSNVRDVHIRFNTLVDAPAGAFSLSRQLPEGNRPPSESLTDWTIASIDEGPATMVSITFDDGMSLSDGEYRLDINGSLVTARGGGPPMNAPFVFGDEQADKFFRLYGDNDGDRVVDLFDFAAFRGTFGKSLGDTGYLSAMDSDGSQSIDLFDFAAFRANFGG